MPLRHALAAIGVLILTVLMAGCPQLCVTPSEAAQWDAYYAAVADADIAEPDEICRSLTAIVPWNDDLIWEGAPGESRVLMVMYTNWPGYANLVGQEYTTPFEFWVTAAPEIKRFCATHLICPDNLDMRMNQLLGLPPGKGYDRFVEFWVDPSDLFRPSPDPEITDNEACLGMPGQSELFTVDEYYLDWFDGQFATYTADPPYPWTRLGYTYDWGNPFSEVGMSEFVIRPGAHVKINAMTFTQDYCRNAS